jgi:hypothetical protein
MAHHKRARFGLHSVAYPCNGAMAQFLARSRSLHDVRDAAKGNNPVLLIFLGVFSVFRVLRMIPRFMHATATVALREDTTDFMKSAADKTSTEKLVALRIT